LLYIAAQTAGAVVGAAVLKFVSPPGVNDKVGATFPNADLAEYKFATLLVELIITFVLVLTVFATCDSQRKGFNGSGPLSIGLSITMCHLWAVCS
jgi:aquaporin-4